MTWIRTVPPGNSDEELLKAMEAQKQLYPIEYASPVHPDGSGSSQIVASHSLIPEALYHAFSTFGALMSPGITPQQPPSRDDRHYGFGHESMCLLNRFPRRVSASRDLEPGTD